LSDGGVVAADFTEPYQHLRANDVRADLALERDMSGWR
jgi:hypothetical protein